MNLTTALRTKWYPIFLPKSVVNSFKIQGWKILVINSGTTPGKPLLCQRYGDAKKQHLNFQDIEKNFLAEDNFIKFATHHGYHLIDKQEGILKFEPIKSRS
jgi:hypothetical protein